MCFHMFDLLLVILVSQVQVIVRFISYLLITDHHTQLIKNRIICEYNYAYICVTREVLYII